MLYYIFRPIIRLVLRAYFRKIYYTNEHKVPKGLPKMYALNHPTSFIDPIVLATHSNEKFNFILRGDVYRSPKIVQWALRSINCIPIFRQSEGFKDMRKNQMTFEYCFDLWKKKENIQVLVEGHTKHEKRLRPIAKGPARMILGYYEKYKDENFAIIPVGLNYTDSHEARSNLMIDFGEPVYLKEFLPAYEENERKAIREITQRIQKDMRSRIIHVQDPEDDDLANKILDIYRNKQPFSALPVVERKDEKPLFSEWNIIEKLNEMEEDTKKDLRNNVNSYFQKLEKLNLRDIGVAKPERASFFNSIMLVLGFLPGLISAIFHAPVYFIGKKVADKVVKKIEFHASVRIGVWVFGGLIYYLLWLIPLLIIGNWWLVGGLFLMPLLGRIWVLVWDGFCEFRQGLKFNNLKKNVRQELKEDREKIMNLISVEKELIHS